MPIYRILSQEAVDAILTYTLSGMILKIGKNGIQRNEIKRKQ